MHHYIAKDTVQIYMLAVVIIAERMYARTWSLGISISMRVSRALIPCPVSLLAVTHYDYNTSQRNSQRYNGHNRMCAGFTFMWQVCIFAKSRKILMSANPLHSHQSFFFITRQVSQLGMSLLVRL